MKKVKFLVLALILAFSLTACSSPAQSPASGPKVETVENAEITIVGRNRLSNGELQEYERTGTYTGEVIDGILNGSGQFSAVNANGVSWTYTGNFENGRFNGQGCVVFDTGEVQKGTFVDGLFQPTTAELFDSMGALTPAYQLSAANFDFITENADLFPVNTVEAYEKMRGFVDPELTRGQMTKNIDSVTGTLFAHDLEAFEVFEYNIYGHTVTKINAWDGSDSYMVYYDGAIDGLYDRDYVSLAALPVAYSNFVNVNGGAINTIVLIACYVAPIGQDFVPQSPAGATPAFPLSTKDLAGIMREVYDGFPADPVSIKTEENADGTKIERYVLEAEDVIDIYCSETESGEITSIMLLASVNKLTTAELEGTLGRIEASLVGIFEPDQDVLAKVDKDLNIPNLPLSENALTMATGTIAEYVYTISNGVITLSISPKD